jgi:hypothetical protein
VAVKGMNNVHRSVYVYIFALLPLANVIDVAEYIGEEQAT